MKFKCFSVLCSTMALMLCVGCKKEQSSSGGGSNGVPAPASTQASGNQTAADGAAASMMPIPTPKPVPRLVDDHLAPSVWLSVNGRAEPDVPKSWPVIVTATVLGATGAAAEFSVDDVSLQVTDSAGAKVAWPMTRVSKATTLKVDETTGASVTWVAGDTAALSPGTYVMTATLKGNTPNSLRLNLGGSPSTKPGEAEAERTALDVRAKLLQGDAKAALQRAEERVAAFPKEVLGFDLLGDALAALGRKKEAQAAYGRAINLFLAQHTKDHVAPAHLLAKLRTVAENN
jgi:hypothetical protein